MVMHHAVGWTLGNGNTNTFIKSSSSGRDMSVVLANKGVAVAVTVMSMVSVVISMVSMMSVITMMAMVAMVASMMNSLAVNLAVKIGLEHIGASHLTGGRMDVAVVVRRAASSDILVKTGHSIA